MSVPFTVRFYKYRSKFSNDEFRLSILENDILVGENQLHAVKMKFQMKINFESEELSF